MICNNVSSKTSMNIGLHPIPLNLLTLYHHMSPEEGMLDHKKKKKARKLNYVIKFEKTVSEA